MNPIFSQAWGREGVLAFLKVCSHFYMSKENINVVESYAHKTMDTNNQLMCQFHHQLIFIYHAT